MNEAKQPQELQFSHYVSYLANNNISGVMEMSSNWKKIDTKTKIDALLKVIEGKGHIKPIISNILTVKNQ